MKPGPEIGRRRPGGPLTIGRRSDNSIRRHLRGCCPGKAGEARMGRQQAARVVQVAGLRRWMRGRTGELFLRDRVVRVIVGCCQQHPVPRQQRCRHEEHGCSGHEVHGYMMNRGPADVKPIDIMELLRTPSIAVRCFRTVLPRSRHRGRWPRASPRRSRLEPRPSANTPPARLGSCRVAP